MPDGGDTASGCHETDGNGEDEPGVWEVRIGIYATQQQAYEVQERFTRLLFPDPEHPPPCPIPWSAWLLPESAFDEPDFYSELTEQGEAERELRRRHGL